jgi:hypothetical protein
MIGTRTWRAAALTIAVAGAASGIAASQVRDRGAEVLSGTGRLKGRVTTMDASPRPLPRAIVTVTGDGLPDGRIAAITDEEGRFTFDRLPAGRFLLTGTKPGYLAGAYGARRPGRAGVPIQLAKGDVKADCEFAMARGGVITGALRAPSGAPATDITVVALRFPPPGGPMALAVAQSATTDDRGVYRIYGLMPGDYLVSSMMRPAGRLSDVTALSGAQIDAVLRALRRRAGASEADSLSIRSADAVVPPGTYAITPVLYPGTPSPDAATTITLALGEERDGVNFTVGLTRMASIEGVVIEGGTPIKPLIINPTGFELPALTGSAPTFSWQATATGRAFKYTNVVPGRYTITAESSQPGAGWARTDVEVTGDDVSGVTLVMQPAIRLRGRVVFEGWLDRPQDLEQLSIRLVSPRGSVSSGVNYTRMGQAALPPALVQSNGRFEIAGLMPGTYNFLVSVPGPPGWWLRSAKVGDLDVADRPLEVGLSGTLPDAVLTFSDRPGSLSGAILTESGLPAPAYFIVAFPVDRALWLPRARRIQSARAGTDGTWTIANLPGGEYFVAAVSDLAPEDLADPAFLAELVPAAIKVSLGEGEQKTQALRIKG